MPVPNNQRDENNSSEFRENPLALPPSVQRGPSLVEAAFPYVLVVILLPAAYGLAYFSFMSRADTWVDVYFASLRDFALIGPFWAAIVFILMIQSKAGIRTASIAALVMYLLVGVALSAWTANTLRSRLGALPFHCELKTFKSASGK
jgi:hypothetical protein